ncbi:hypothetical protein A3D78_03590 [Candidatus Gottesmanbacteria bacterium RIFCSPHIGHO2_02_FULL_39_14]|uniref:Glycosyltransferase 2-like domain-containing protein n=2 Tax=Candidatus Gottesmaniibacteriota TaxID=1752720 RepID=A0A1F5ZZQ6_9BACT|nr:MAG: hypothetical protein A3D78_03590 [Candidatus Gottesmanbacteria bacterium RIFCSPHIGHO2_02_FULL_39_14]OGG31857.1 MAG: hypothetical protein A3I51_04490 [Candidatus Gottesmanbacteria bacterium RIFCSPLOWO2_02_FULL_38_8]
MPLNNRFSIIIPTYNEKENLITLLPVLKNLYPASNIFIVDDNSQDKTSDFIKKFSRKNKNVHLLQRHSKLGRGSAVIDGLKKALIIGKTDYYLEMDADFSHVPGEIKRLLVKKDPHTLVIGSRYIPGARTVNWPHWRQILSILANFYIRTILKIPLHDFTNGFRLYPKYAAEIIVMTNPAEKGYTTLSETAYILFLNGFKFVEVPTTFVNRKLGKTKISLKEYLQSLTSIIRIKQNYHGSKML